MDRRAARLGLDNKNSQERKLKRVVLTVDSRSRENPSKSIANDYSIRFPAISQVRSARLISAEVPNSQYVINESNNVIDLDDVGGTTGLYVVELTPGTYTATALADEINLQLNDVFSSAPDSIFTVSYLESVQKMRITRLLGGTFSILWISGATNTRSIAKRLGFTADSVAVTTCTSDELVTLAGENFVFLVIKKFGAIENTENQRDVFAKIVWNIPPRFYCYDSFIANTVEFREPIYSLDNLKVQFVQQDGSLYNFNGLDHSFTIELFVHA